MRREQENHVRLDNMRIRGENMTQKGEKMRIDETRKEEKKLDETREGGGKETR